MIMSNFLNSISIFDEGSEQFLDLAKWALTIMFGIFAAGILFRIASISWDVMQSSSDSKWKDLKDKIKGLVIGALLFAIASPITYILIEIIKSKMGS